MTALTLVGEQTGDETYEVTATPEHGNRIKLRVGKGSYSAGYSSRTGYLVQNRDRRRHYRPPLIRNGSKPRRKVCK